MNKERGILYITTESKKYPFKLSTNALCTIEQMSGRTVMDLTKSMGFTELRLCFWAGIHEYDESVDVKEVGEIIDEVGWDKANDLLLESLSYTFPNLVKKTGASNVDGSGETEKNPQPQQSQSNGF